MRNVFSLNGLLWIAQGCLALFFIGGSGAPKLLLPADALPMPIPLSQQFVWFIGTCEVLGGLGLILPGLTRIQPWLTALAAACLFVLTLCAATYQLMAGQPANAVFAVAVGLVAVGVAYARWRVVPLDGAQHDGLTSRRSMA
jgi:DoxX-like family